jgi:hypothetical protein
MSTWQVLKTTGEEDDNYILKEYPYKSQAYIYCWLNGYVNYAGRYGFLLSDEVEIREVEKECISI